jgi:hypothetical protein
VYDDDIYAYLRRKECRSQQPQNGGNHGNNNNNGGAGAGAGGGGGVAALAAAAHRPPSRFSSTNALIVGDPVSTHVFTKGEINYQMRSILIDWLSKYRFVLLCCIYVCVYGLSLFISSHLTHDQSINQSFNAFPFCLSAVEVSLEYHLNMQTVMLTVNFVDRLLCSVNVNRARLQLVGITAMLVAAKYEVSFVLFLCFVFSFVFFY